MLVDGVDEDGVPVGRTYREAPEIDGVVRLGAATGAPVRARSSAPSSPAARAPTSKRCRSAPVDPASVGPVMSARSRPRDAAVRPDALATPANFLTVGRMLVGIPTLVLMSRQRASWPTVALWFVITSTDSLDGFLARRDGATRSGAFLDPVADKTLVLGGVRGARAAGRHLVVARGRDRRARAVRLGVPHRSPVGAGSRCPARQLGKYKAFFQYLAIGAVLLPWTADDVGLQQAVLWLVVALTVVSAADIVRHGWHDWQRDQMSPT